MKYIVHRGAYHFLKKDNTEEKRMFLGDFICLCALLIAILCLIALLNP